MKNKFRKACRLLVVGAMGTLLMLPIGVQEAKADAVKIDGKCTLTIDANKHISAATTALGTGKCAKAVSGIYYKGANRFDMVGSLTTPVYNGQVELIRVRPFDTYEITIYTIPLKGTVNPPAPVKPKPEPKPEPLPQGQVFTDVPKSFWAYKEINQMEDAGIVHGYPDGRYGPNNHIRQLKLFQPLLIVIKHREIKLSLSIQSEVSLTL